MRPLSNRLFLITLFESPHTVVCVPPQRPLQCCFCFMLVWTEWRPAGWADPKHWVGLDISGYCRSHSDSSELGRIHGAQWQGRDAVGQLLLVLLWWLFCVILILFLMCVLLPRAHCLWEMTMALSFWGKELPNVEHMLRPFTTKSWNFKKVPPQLF